ncbi:MAG: discoidin domain-containing protein, partial [Tannerella sp.]|jgi:hypothetical protein|nr:discoidin domain-containing protein [Tannerella sp.]
MSGLTGSINNIAELSKPVDYEFIIDKNGYKVQFSNGEQTWKTAAGVLGVRIAYDSVGNVTNPEYVNYKNYSKTEGGYKASANLRTEDGSCIKVTDYFTNRKSGVEIIREIEVLEAGSALGFMTMYPVRDVKTGKAEERMWFAPSAYYGNEERTFWGRGVKIGFNGIESVCPVDVISTPVIMNYHENKVFSLTDVTEGHRETVVEDMYANQQIVLINEDLNLPGIGLKNVQSGVSTHLEMYHAYPANTYNWLNSFPQTRIWRMLPLKQGLKRTCAFVVSMDSCNDFDASVTRTWERSFYAYSVIDKRYSKNDVYLALIDNVQRTFGYKSYGDYLNAPQYMAKSDHPYPTSGFLYRNTDLAALMIAAGYRLGRQDYIDTAVEVMDYQVKNDLIDTNSPHVHERAQSEGIMGVLEGYEYAKANGLNKPQWLDYILEKGEEKLKVTDDMVVPLLLKLYGFTKDNRYLNRASELMDLYDDIHAKYGYQGDALANTRTSMTSREAAAVYLNCYIELYEYTRNVKYLEHARRASTYFESTHIAQSINLLTAGTTGYEYRDNDPSSSEGKRFKEMGYVGNAKIMPYGLSYICSPSVGVDMFGAYEIPYIYKLGKFLDREHYRYFTEYLQYNTTLYVNMGDKHWLMDDLRYSSGMGFMNEYIGLAASTDPVSAGRGTMHISNLAWNMFVLLHSYEEMLKVNPDYLADDANRNFDMAKFKYVDTSSELNGIYRSYNAVDKNTHTVWAPKTDDLEKTITVKLGEFCRIDHITLKGFNPDDITGVDVNFSDDGVTYRAVEENTKLDSNGIVVISGNGNVAMFVKVKLRANAGKNVGISDLSINGLPLTLKPLQIGKSCTSSPADNAIKALEWDNSTYAQFDSTHDAWITVDLGRDENIYETGLFFDFHTDFQDLDHITKPTAKPVYKYKIEYSSDNANWTMYQDCSNNEEYKAVHVFTKAAKARYVRLTVFSVSDTDTLRLRQFKILG